MGGMLASRLAGQGHTVFAYGRRPVIAIPSQIPNYAQWDLTRGPINVPEVDAVIHCAAQVGDWGPEAGYRRVNVDGTKVVLETFAKADRFVHVSSASVYSNDQPNHDLTENASVGIALLTAYARTKAEAEKVVLASRRSAVILRPHIVYGPGDTTLMPRVLAARLLGWLPVPGDGRNRISATHIFNFLHAIECVLATPSAHGIFNIADGEPASVDELLRTLLRRNGVEPRLIYLPRAIAWAIALASERICQLTARQHAPRVTRYLVTQIADGHTLDLSRAYQLLGYAPRYNFHHDPACDGVM